MTAVIPDSEALQALLQQLDQVVAKRHPWLLSRMMLVRSQSVQGDEILRGLVDRFGECRWSAGRWRTLRTQLRLPGM